MAASALDWIGETRLHLMGGVDDEIAVIPTSVLGSANQGDIGTQTFPAPLAGVVRSATIAMDIELLKVVSMSGALATVVRGWGGSPAQAHGNNVVAYINPAFSDWAIFQALNQELDALSSPTNGLFQMSTLDIQATANTVGYDVSVLSIIDVWDVRWQNFGDSTSWPQVRSWRFIPSSASGVFFTGRALMIYDDIAPGRVIHITYKAPFTRLTDQTTTLSTTGLPPTAYDIPALGAAARLLAAREARRSITDSQSDPREASEVPPGTARNSSAYLWSLRKQRVVEESARLKKMYPDMSRTM